MIQMQTVSIDSPGSTVAVDYHVLCFEPVALIFRAVIGPDGYSSGNDFRSIGFADADLNQYAVGTREDNGVNPNGFWAFTYPYLNNCIQFGVAGTNLTGILSDGFTLDWGIGDDVKVEVIAFGGDDCQAAARLINPTTGAESFTGYGFEGQLLMMLDARGSVWNTEDTTRMNFDLGFASGPGSGEQFSMHGISNSGANPSQSASQFKTGVVNVWGNSVFDSFDADGFSMTTAGNFGGVNMPTLILGDATESAFKVGIETQKTSTGTKAFTGVGFSPGAVIAAGVCDTNSTGTLRADAFFTIGAYDGAEHHNIWGGSNDGVDPTEVATRVSGTLISHSEPMSTTHAEAVVDTLDADGATLDWTTADGTARVFGLVFCKCVPGNPCPAFAKFYATLV